MNILMGFLFLVFSLNGFSKNYTQAEINSVEKLEKLFRLNPQTPGLMEALKKSSFHLKQKSVPTLIKVMKEGTYPDENRWHATMLLAQTMGKKSAPFIAKFSEHPNWMMRLASLKALLGLGQKEYVKVYKNALIDSSLIVRVQALDNISRLKIETLAPQVWNMLYDHSNYSGEAGKRRRTSIVKSIIRTLGDLNYKKASPSMAKLIQKPKYKDLVHDLNYSLEKITGKKSPNSIEEKKKFWAYLVAKKN